MTWKLLPDKKVKLLTQCSVLSKESAKEIIETYKDDHRLEHVSSNRFSFRSISLDPVEWIKLYEPVTSVILDANVNNYGFKLQGISSLHYIEVGDRDFLDWNMDLMESYRETNKLSIYIPLNDDFEGGRFFVKNPLDTEIKPVIGEMTMFPSYLISKHDPTSAGIKRMVAGTVTGLPFS